METVYAGNREHNIRAPVAHGSVETRAYVNHFAQRLPESRGVAAPSQTLDGLAIVLGSIVLFQRVREDLIVVGGMRKKRHR